jgi:polysaccharide export outer membrane protein
VVSPKVRVVFAQRGAPSVVVLGEVRVPGVFEFAPDAGLLQALGRAGGLTEFADHDGIYLLRRGNPPVLVRFDYDIVVAGDTRSNAIVLRDGDVIVVE